MAAVAGGAGDKTAMGTLPQHACDCHVELTGPPGLLPDPIEDDEAPATTLAQLEERLEAEGIERAVLIQPTMLGFDHTIMLQALALHRNRLRGIARIAADTSDSDLEYLAHTGIRGLRPPDLDPDALTALAARAEPLGLHLDLVLDAKGLARLAPVLAHLPVDIVIGELGRPVIRSGIRQAGFRALLRLVRAGRCWVRLTGPPDAGLDPFAEALIEADPTRLIWGSVWPHPRQIMEGLTLLARWAPDDRLRHLILVENPARLYRFDE
jgi:predicted TIM-barrel fold metal-dependent hydrolase